MPDNTEIDSIPSKSAVQPNAEQSITTAPAPSVQDDAPFTRNIYEGIYLKNYPKSEWTYNTQSQHYGNKGVMGTLGQMKQEMVALHALVSTHGGTLSVGVYPWPGQILYDEAESLQVRTWREFCATRCLHFYNAFPSFFRLAEATNKDAVVHKFYFAGDAHFNTAGNKVIAETILSQGVQ